MRRNQEIGFKKSQTTRVEYKYRLLSFFFVAHAVCAKHVKLYFGLNSNDENVCLY